MALDDLKETIETLARIKVERIQTHRPYLEGNETRTRQALKIPCCTSWVGMLETPIPSNLNTA